MFIQITKELKEKLTLSETMVIEFINSNEQKVSNMSIVDIAELTFTSPATVSRAIKKIGLNGFTEFRYKLLANINKNKQYEEYSGVNNILEKSLLEVVRTIENISLKDVVDFIKTIEYSSRVYILARGLTELVANEFDYKLKLLGHNSFFISDPNVMKKITASLREDEIVIVFSLRGETECLVDSCQNAKKQGCKVLSCCCEKKSKLGILSDINIVGEKHKEIAIKDYEVTSRIPLQVISRVIIDYLIEYKKNN